MHRPSIVLTVALLGAMSAASPTQAATFLFIRHAESTTNAGTAATPEELVNPPLTDLGRQQAIDLAVTLGGLDLTTIYVSSFQRTALTIAPTAALFGLTPHVVPEIREWSFGDGPLDIAAITDMVGEWLTGNTAARIAGVPTSESLDELNARVVPAYNAIIARHADEDGVVAIIGHGGSIAWTMPTFAANVTLPFAVQNGLNNTGIVKVALFDRQPFVTDWQGTPPPIAAPAAVVPLPAGGFLLIAALGALAAIRRRARAAAQA